VPVPELNDDVARMHDVLAVVEPQHPLALQENAVVHGRDLWIGEL